MNDNAKAQNQDVRGFEDLFDRILEESDGDKISIDEVLDAFSHRSFGPLILVPALLAALPTGVIPGVPMLLGLVIILISAQVLIGRSHPWIPKRLRNVEVDRDVFEQAWERFRPIFKRLDSILKPRLTWLTEPPFLHVVAVIAILLSISMVPLEFVPFAVAVPGFAITALGMGLATRDGFIVLLGLVLCGVTVWILSSTFL